MIDCPCCSGKSFDKCCQPVLKNNSALTALELMRSRYTAFYQCEAEYLYNTTHPTSQTETSLHEIEEWSKENKWTKLEIVETEKGSVNDKSGVVEFKAFYTDKNGVDQIHHEKSNFLKEEGKWFYFEGKAVSQNPVIDKKVSRNEPCPCGSGKKYKKCCA